MTSTDRTPLVIPPIDFATPTGDEMVAIDKGFGGGAVGGRKPPPFRPHRAEKYVVVLLNAYPCEEYEGKSCVMAALGPYDTDAAARVAAATYPDWSAPHIVMLTRVLS